MANATPQTGLSNGIREVLRKAGLQLTVAQIEEALPADIDADVSRIGAICRTRAKAGEFTDGVEGGKCVYGLNPSWVPGLKPAQADAHALATSTPPPADFATRAAAGDAVIEAGDQALRDQPAALSPALKSLVTDGPAPPRPKRRVSLDLPVRLAVIAADLEDAIGDACDARLPHELIKALTVASGATHRAARQLEA